MGRSQFSNPETFVPIPETATCDSVPEDINGISAIHCSFTEADNIANSLDVASAQGDIWFAEDGNYVVKYDLEAQDLSLKGRFEESGGYYEFETYTIGFELEDIDSVAISLPAEAEGTEVLDQTNTVTGGSGLAAPDGADVFVDTDPGGLSYYSTADQATLIDFHLRELPAAGWQAVPDESYVDDNYALLLFENEEGLLRAFIQKDIDGGNFVSITLPFEAPGGVEGSTGGDTATGGGEAAGEMPVLDDAAELFSAGGATTYATEADIATVIEFYRQELSAQGWVEDTSSTVSTADVAVLMFSKDGTSLTAAINKEADGRVRVSLLQQ